MKTKKFTQPWFIRRAVYAIVGVALLVAAGFGLIDEGQIDTIAASPILGALVAFLASAKTNPGSDSTATAEDVALAAAASHGGPSVQAVVAETMNQWQSQVQSYGEHAAEAVASFRKPSLPEGQANPDSEFAPAASVADQYTSRG